MTKAPGTKRRIKSSSTVKLPCTANRVTSMNAAQIVTVPSAAKSPSSRGPGRVIDPAFHEVITDLIKRQSLGAHQWNAYAPQVLDLQN
ncbi:hypothetical protein [Jannaschia faecimaris]|uniref:hypothetical protein n=1 Tax=Jannaschia faecimaris TaxID=1244108 RepID=UPI001FCE16CD|nr:hypothetical protein [Jannaschia faecimaris]